MDIDIYIQDFKKNHNGTHSVIYNYLKDRLHKQFCEMEIPFAGEFLFFEDRYIRIYEDIKARKLDCGNIIDIGCQLGIQSELFKNEFKYTGIEAVETNFFNNKECKFINGTFPYVTNLDYKNAIIISSMSLGYFKLVDDIEESNKIIVNELKKAKYLYIATNTRLLRRLAKYFNITHLDTGEVLKNEKQKEVTNNLYFLERTSYKPKQAF